MTTSAPPSRQPSRWIKVISTHGQVRGVAVQATELAQEMARIHGLTGWGARGVGEATIAALLVASYCKAGERVNVNIRGSGHFSQALVDAHPEGHVRGFVTERALSAEDQKALGETGPWGEGILAVLRTKGEQGNQPYIGSVPLLTGHLAKDLTFYWAQSEQVPSAVGIVVEMDGEKVKSAGGFLVQAMPGANAEELAAIEEHISAIHTLASEFLGHSDPVRVLAQIFQSTSFVIVEEKPLRFECNCSRDRVARALRLVGAEELEVMAHRLGHAEVKCDFCAKAYEFDRAALEAMLAEVRGQSN